MIFRPSSKQGMTLIELLVAMSVLGIVTALAMPSFAQISARSCLVGSSNQLLTGLLAARMTAISRNTPTTFCAGNTTEGCHGDWARAEWIVFLDRARDGQLGTDDTVQAADRLKSSCALELTGNGPLTSAVVFQPSGMATWPGGSFAAGRVRVCVARPIGKNATDLVLIGSGRVVTEARDYSGSCPPP